MKNMSINNQPLKDVHKEINVKTKEFLENKRNANNLLDIISAAEDANTEEVLLAVIKSFHKIFSRAIASQDMYIDKPPTNDEDLSAADKYKVWLRSRYNDALTILLGMFHHNQSSVPELSLCTVMKFVEAEGLTPLKRITGNHLYFPSLTFEAIMKSLVTHDQNVGVIMRFQEYLEYDDVRYFAMKILLKDLCEKSEEEKSETYLENVCCVLENLSMPQVGPEDGDQLTKFISKYPENTVNLKITSLKEHKKLFTSVWLQFLKHKLSTALYKKVLLVLHEKVMNHMTSPLLLSDFLTNSYNIGGAISLLALNGLFILVHNYNLEYPDFYKKLYALFNPTVFHVKYKSRFFFLSDLFLTSTHLPAYLVAAFAKRLSRLALTAPPNVLTIIIPFVYNLLIRHPSCQVLVHRTSEGTEASDPFDMNEEDPAECKALQSSLWELKTLQSHYHHSIASEARKVEQHLPSQEIQLDEILDMTASELIEREVKKKIKTAPTNFEKPSGLFSVKDQISQFWTLT